MDVSDAKRLKALEDENAKPLKLLADLDAWLVHYNTGRPDLGYRDMVKRPIEIVISCVSREG